MAYLDSDSVEIVYPSTRRGTDESRYMYEEAIVRIINQIVDTDAYAITQDVSSDDYEFSIHGYYFKVDMSSVKTLMSTYNNVYANILITTSGYKELFGQDDEEDAVYTGLILSDSNLAGQGESYESNSEVFTCYYLKILEKDTQGNWKIPENSLYKIKDTSLLFMIDGGDVTTYTVED